MPRSTSGGQAFLAGPWSSWLVLWLDATVRQRKHHRVVPMAVMVAVAVKTDGRRVVRRPR